MIISTLFQKYFNRNIDVINEQEVSTLGLVTSNIEAPYCTFIDSEEYLKYIPKMVKMIITKGKIAQKINDCKNFGVCIVDNPRIEFFKLHNALKSEDTYLRKNFITAIGENCTISEFSNISKRNVKIGNNVIIEEFADIKENTAIGDNCIIRAGAKIGGVDFEFKKENQSIFGVAHYGGVILGNNVEIQCNSVVNRGVYPWDNTSIDDFTKIDALSIVSHGVKIGKRNLIACQTAIGGRTIIGDDCWFGLGTTIKNGLTIGNNVRSNVGAVVTKNVNNNESLTGNFAIQHEKFIEIMKKIAK